MSWRALTPHEKALLVAVGVYAPPGTLVPIQWSPIEQGGGYYAGIGSLHFPTDVNNPTPDAAAGRRWRLAVDSLAARGYIKRSGATLYDVTDSGRQQIERLSRSPRKTPKGISAWDAVKGRLEELAALQNVQANPPSNPGTHTRISVASGRLLEATAYLA
jgi:hypothetical protein